MPVLVTWGSSEPIVPSAWAQTATRLLPLGELAVLLGPHNANYGAADHLGELVRVFLDRRGRPTVAKPTERETLAPGSVLVSSLQAPAR